MDKAVRETAECVESVTTGKVPLRPGMLFWIATHKGCYFWVRSAFQLVAFSLLIVTLVILNDFLSEYWHTTVYLLVAIHSIDVVSFTLDLISFTTRNIKLLYYKIALDVISFCLALFVQAKFASSLNPEITKEMQALEHPRDANFVKMR